MDIYESFAGVYDTFMDNVPYDAWASYLHRTLDAYGIRDGLVLDLGCGTGQMTRRLRDLGYDMIGADLSEDMLQIAQEAEWERFEELQESRPDAESPDAVGQDAESPDAVGQDAESPDAGGPDAESPDAGGPDDEPPGKGGDILYLLQDMRSFELYGTVRAVVSVCDCLNYMTQEEDLERVFSLVNNYLDPGGVFLFDLNTEYHYREVCAEHTFAESRDEGSFIWENHFDPKSCVNEYDLTLFVRRSGALYERCRETHRERAWSLEQVRTLLERAGMEFIWARDAYTDDPLREDTDRMLVLAREHGKAGVGE